MWSHHVPLLAHVDVAAGLPLDLQRHALGARHLVPRQRVPVQRRGVEVLVERALHVEQPAMSVQREGGGRQLEMSEQNF